MRVLFTAFCGTSAELLMQEAGWQGLALPNDKKEDARLLIREIASGKYDFAVSFGQKPNIKDKVYVETTARNAGDFLETGFACGKLMGAFSENNLDARLSRNAGTSFCNHLYWRGLEYIKENGMAVKMVFVHIPMRKNISDFGGFCKKIQSAVEEGVSF